jgi:L-lysine exporter family protein LysE/ArgO
VLPIVLTCAISDALLIAAGVGGFGRLAELAPWFAPAMRYGGAAFLFVYGLLSFRSAWRGNDGLSAEGQGAGSMVAAIGTCLALTWLNPHVYLDTLGLIGAVSTQYVDPIQKTAFGIGAVTSSFVFFFSLGYGARLLAPIMQSARAWRILDVLIGLVMWALAVKLLS